MTKAIIIVFDGLRPDCITPERMPHLYAFQQKARSFPKARTIFPSMTRVATTSIATGAPPSVHGIVGNAFYYPEVIAEHVLDVSDAGDIARAEAALDGGFIMADTFADVLARAGLSFHAVHLGSAGSAHCLNPRVRQNGHATFSVHGVSHTQTPEAVMEAVEAIGPLPKRTLPRFDEQDYAADLFSRFVLPVKRPDVALVWFNEPDTSFHYRGLGHEETLAVMRRTDLAFKAIIDAAADEAPGALLIVASDHGQISSFGAVDVAGELTKAGFNTVKASKRSLDGADFVLTGGNMGEVRALGGNAHRLPDLAHWLMQQDWCGMVFSASDHPVTGGIDGTLSLKTVMLDHPRAPELVYVLRSHPRKGEAGLEGDCLITASDVPVGGGMHGGLNEYEVNSVLMLAGLGITAGVDGRMCGVIDIAPTLLHHLRLPAPATMRGCPLTLAAEAEIAKVFESHREGFSQRLEAVERKGHLFPIHGGRL